MMLKKFSELGTVHRGEPCQEYPGMWIVYTTKPYGQEDQEFHNKEAARHYANAVARFNDVQKVSVCWKCSDNDPRVGQVWFTGFYEAYEIPCNA